MSFPNVLANPGLSGWTLNRVVQDKNSNTKHIEYPDSWEMVAWSSDPNDPNAIPASYHRDRGFGLAAGFMSWRGGYVQRAVKLKAGQRYLAKAIFHVNMSFHSGVPEGWQSHINWYFIFNESGNQVDTHLGSTAHSSFGGQEMFMAVVECQADATVDFGLMFHSRYPSTQGEILVLSIELLKVPQGYGSNPLIVGGSAGDAIAPPVTPTPVTPNPDTPPTRDDETETGDDDFNLTTDPVPAGSTDNLTDAMTDDDLETVIDGLTQASTLASFPEELQAAFSRLATAFQSVLNGRRG